ARDAPGVADARLGSERLLDLDRVLPGVAHVVDVGELLDALAQKLAELDLAFIADLQLATEAVVPLLGVAVPLVPDVELVQVVVVPAHADLNNVVQCGERTALHLDTTPDRWLDVPQGNLQLVDLGRSFRLCHRLSQSFRLLPCLPFQKGQNGQSSPTGKS